MINFEKYIILRSIAYDQIIKLLYNDVILSSDIDSIKLEHDNIIAISIYYIKIKLPNSLNYLVDNVEFLGFENKINLEKHLPYDFEEKLLNFTKMISMYIHFFKKESMNIYLIKTIS